jgi:hypothetical protein
MTTQFDATMNVNSKSDYNTSFSKTFDKMALNRLHRMVELDNSGKLSDSANMVANCLLDSDKELVISQDDVIMNIKDNIRIKIENLANLLVKNLMADAKSDFPVKDYIVITQERRDSILNLIKSFKDINKTLEDLSEFDNIANDMEYFDDNMRVDILDSLEVAIESYVKNPQNKIFLTTLVDSSNTTGNSFIARKLLSIIKLEDRLTLIVGGSEKVLETSMSETLLLGSIMIKLVNGMSLTVFEEQFAERLNLSYYPFPLPNKKAEALELENGKPTSSD